jgi:integrase
VKGLGVNKFCYGPEALPHRDEKEDGILAGYMHLMLARNRVGEMCSIRAEHIDYDRSFLHIPESNAKGKKARTVALLPPAVAALRAHLTGRTQLKTRLPKKLFFQKNKLF